MRGLVEQFRKNPFIRQYTATLCQSLPGKNWMGELNQVFNFVRNNIRYIQDVNEVETVQTPLATLQLQHGDCDDMATLLCAMLESIGYPTHFVAIGFELGQFDHVFCEAYIQDSDQWVAMDPTEDNDLGWSPDGYACEIVYPAES